jgi:HEAT repeat protein
MHTGRWRALLVVLVPAFSVPAQQPAGPERIKVAVERLEAAFRGTEEIEQVEAIEEAAGLVDPEIIALVARGFRSRSTAVREKAIETLGRTPHPDALKALHDLYRTDTRLRENEELFADLLTAIGRHGDKSSIPLLGEVSFKHLTVRSGRARIMGLARIRDKAAVEALVQLSRQAGPVRRKKSVETKWSAKFRPYMRAALVILTGQDFEYSRPEWRAWWYGNEEAFEVSRERPPVAAEIREIWERFWGEPYDERGEAPRKAPLGAPFEPVSSPTREQVEEAVEALKTAYGDDDESVRIEAIQTHGAVLDKRVIHWLARGLRDKSSRVRTAAVDTLGWTRHTEALKQLHRMYRREHKILANEDESLFAALLKAIGRHGDESSVVVLADNPFSGLTLATAKARILGLGNIRSRKSLETLVKGMRLAGGNPRRSRRYGEPRFMQDFRLALAVLTGEDLGDTKEAWEEWWRGAKRAFKVSKERPPLDDALRRRWEEYWREPYDARG